MTAIQMFDESIADSMRLRALYNHCVTSLFLPGDYGDLLRMSLIYCMSALDKLVHDLVVHNMVEIFANRRVATAKYKSETINLAWLFTTSLLNAAYSSKLYLRSLDIIANMKL